MACLCSAAEEPRVQLKQQAPNLRLSHRSGSKFKGHIHQGDRGGSQHNSKTPARPSIQDGGHMCRGVFYSRRAEIMGHLPLRFPVKHVEAVNPLGGRGALEVRLVSGKA